MLRAILYFLIAAVLNFILTTYAFSQPLGISLYYSAAFGTAVALAYLLDNERLGIKEKAAASFGVMLLVLALGILIYDLRTAVPALIVYSSVFMGYYMAASFRGSKSLRR